MRRHIVRNTWLGALAVTGVSLFAWAGSWPSAEAGRSQVRRPVAIDAAGEGRFDAIAAAGTRHQLRRSASTTVRSVTVDRTLWTGYENAIYAPDENTVFVAFKRFTQDPGNPGYIPAELRVARSIDGGATWQIKVVDPEAIEQGDTIDNSVSIDGDFANGRSTLYIAYHTRSSGLFADMKLKVAKSTDGGVTWTILTVADGYAGDHNGIRVLDASTVLVSAHTAGTEEGVHVFATLDGGLSWSDSPVEGGLGNGYYTGIGAAGLQSVLVSWYNSLYPDHTDLNAGRRTGAGSWQTTKVDGTQGDLTGLGSSAWVGAGPTGWIAYEADTSQGSFVKVAKRSPGIPGWTIVPVQPGPSVGVNTAVHSVGTLNVYVSYWYGGTGTGQAILASSSDAGATWTPLVIPDQRYAQVYLDSTAPTTAVQFESYQTTDQFGDNPALRVARVEP
jgi:hypothetical protein